MLPYHFIGFYVLYVDIWIAQRKKTLLKFLLFHITGNEEILSQANSTALLADCAEEAPTSCNKETGEKRRLQKWSRGHFFYCSRQWIYWQMESPFLVCEPWLIFFRYICSCFEMLQFLHIYMYELSHVSLDSYLFNHNITFCRCRSIVKLKIEFQIDTISITLKRSCYCFDLKQDWFDSS